MASKQKRCPKCGGLMYEPAVFAAFRGDLSCVICGMFIAKPDVQAMELEQEPKRAACKVQGCPGMVSVAHNKSGFCIECGRDFANWEKAPRARPRPFVTENGVMIRNPKTEVYRQCKR